MDRLSLVALRPAVQHYAWGGHEFLPRLLGVANEPPKPFAELWVGAHPKAPSALQFDGPAETLDKFVESAPEPTLGRRVAERFDKRLPFLLKALDVAQALSIQVHPTKEAAERGFAEENARGVPFDAPFRNYKDDNHKPEIMVALSEFWLLHGFKTPELIEATFAAEPELSFLAETFGEGDYEALYARLMSMPQAEVNERLSPLVERIDERHRNGLLEKEEAGYWAKRALEASALSEGDVDRGVFSIYLFNIVRCQPGEGVFQDAGVPHAYLEGACVELMANSDNVLRGGLTPKHVDVPELLKHVRFEPTVPTLLKGEAVSEAERVYRSPAPDFELSRVELKPGQDFHNGAADGPEALLCVSGEAEAMSGEKALALRQGGALFVADSAVYALRSREGAVVFKARVP